MSKDQMEQKGLSPFALLTAEDTAKMDQAAGDDLEHLMENAGRACADVFCRQVFPEQSVLIATGPGNNGGDGYVMARYLKERGYNVAVSAWRSPKTQLAQKAAKNWDGKIVDFLPQKAGKFDWVVDAIFGAGLNPERALPPEISAFMEAAENRMAIDLPSGIASDSGALCGVVPEYQLTVSFTAKRPGHLLSPGRQKCGKVEVKEIGLPEKSLQAVERKIFYNQPGLWKLPLQRVGNDYHKYTRGVVSIVGGSTMPGAACLATEGARRSGAGLVRVALSPEMFLPFVLQHPSAIADKEPLENFIKDSKRKVWVCGSGLTTEEAEKAFKILTKSEAQIVADAGLLGWAAGNPLALQRASLLTPHEGEFSKLFGHEGIFNLRDKNSNRLLATQAAAKLTGNVVLLKGSETIIAHPDGRIAINTHASPALATAGSGDILAGVAGMCLAAGMDTWEGACAAVWLHGEAGISASKKQGGWPIAEDISKELGHARHRAEEQQNQFDSN